MIDYSKKTVKQLEDLLKDFEVAKEYIEAIVKEKNDIKC